MQFWAWEYFYWSVRVTHWTALAACGGVVIGSAICTCHGGVCSNSCIWLVPCLRTNTGDLGHSREISSCYNRSWKACILGLPDSRSVGCVVLSPGWSGLDLPCLLGMGRGVEVGGGGCVLSWLLVPAAGMLCTSCATLSPELLRIKKHSQGLQRDMVVLGSGQAVCTCRGCAVCRLCWFVTRVVENKKKKLFVA